MERVAHGRRAFGARAASWAQRFDPDFEICAVDEGGLAAGLRDVVVRRRDDVAHYATILLPHPRVYALEKVLGVVMPMAKDLDDLLRHLDLFKVNGLRFNDQPQAAFTRLPAGTEEVAGAILKTADRVLFRSWAEQARIEELLRWRWPDGVVASPTDAQRSYVPTGAWATEGSYVALWAGDAPAAIAVLAGIATQEIGITVYVISDRISGANVVPTRVAGDVLAGAAAIVDLSVDDPSVALDFVRFNVPVVVTSTSGAAELLDGAGVCDPWDYESVRSTLLKAVLLPPPSPRPEARARLALARPQPRIVPTTGPLVSVVVTTFERSETLALALTSIARQTYRNVEAVVVNDGGPPVDDVVARFPQARCINREVNGGPAATRNSGIKVAQGKYICFLDDDDELFPDHVAHFVQAMERAGAGFAHCMALTQFHEPLDDDRVRVVSYKMEMDRTPTLVDLLINNYAAPLTFFMRTSVFEECGLFTERDVLGSTEDLEMWIRIAKRYPLLDLSRVGALYTRRTDKTTMSHRLRERRLDSFSKIYAWHPVTGRPILEERRKGMLEQWRQMGGVYTSTPVFLYEIGEVLALREPQEAPPLENGHLADDD
ncbi:MAG: glycosyltransferase family 2 protein [Candidatus Eremiobacteraeota bacterium]|nr:glycosyltransferase family 2 protein [Candidatus Eremiobacteraeota bacterium]